MQTTSKPKVGFLTDSYGNKSMTRLLSLVVCLTGLAMGVIGMLKGNITTASASLAGSFVGLALGAKALGQRTETKK
jgi:hypothetical protein